MEKAEQRLFTANLLASAGIAMLMMLGISTASPKALSFKYDQSN
jgi:hypothetical protein